MSSFENSIAPNEIAAHNEASRHIQMSSFENSWLPTLLCKA